MEHDQRLKNIVRTFFGSYMGLFHQDLAARIDFARIEWIDKELLQSDLKGKLRQLDLVAKVPIRRGPGLDEPYTERLIIIFVEVESADSTTDLKRRFPMYYLRICDEHPTSDVLPLALYLNMRMEGIGIDHATRGFEGRKTLDFCYDYVALKGLDALEYLEKDNCLAPALSALMRIPADRIAWVGAEAMRKISESDLTEEERYYLAELVDAYLPLTDDQQKEFQRIMSGEMYRGAKEMNETTFERGIKKGRLEGKAEGRLEGKAEGRLEGKAEGRLEGKAEGIVSMVCRSLSSRFGPLSPAIVHQLKSQSIDQLESLFDRIATAGSIEELGLGRP